MKASVPLRHKFVESVPELMEDGVIYVSIRYRSVIHLCACGCGSEVVTPLGPTDWRLTFDGVSVSLDPSVGNWGLPCRSHYIIKRNKAVWAGDWSEERIAVGREYDQKNKDRYYGQTEAETKVQPLPPTEARTSFLGRVLKFFIGKSAGK